MNVNPKTFAIVTLVTIIHAAAALCILAVMADEWYIKFPCYIGAAICCAAYARLQPYV